MLINLALIIFGLIIGSFLTVCVYRIPFGREKGPGDFSLPEEDLAAEENEQGLEEDEEHAGERMTICYPKRSFCPACRAQLRWWHNIPLFSWLCLGGKCAFCGAKISWYYPVIELLSVGACLLSYHSANDLPTAAVVYALCCVLIVITFIDIDYYIIPDVISFPGMAVGALLAAANHAAVYYERKPIFGPPVVPGLAESLWGLLAGAGFLYSISWLYRVIRRREGLGLGDVKLLAVIGLVLGPEAAIYTIFIGSLVGAVFGVLQLLLQGQKLSRPLPFGPYLAIAACLYLFTDPQTPMLFIRSLLVPYQP